MDFCSILVFILGNDISLIISLVFLSLMQIFEFELDRKSGILFVIIDLFVVVLILEVLCFKFLTFNLLSIIEVYHHFLLLYVIFWIYQLILYNYDFFGLALIYIFDF